MIVITREVPSSVNRAELTHVERVPIDVPRAREQHRRYCDVLRSLGCQVLELPADDAYPDSVFVEDTAIVLEKIAVITRPGALSRRGEVEAMAAALAPYRKLVRIEAPATIDGGDVLVAGRTIYVGLSTRTNEEALDQLRRHARGYEVVGVPVGEALHLKTAVTRVASDALLINREWLDAAPFAGWKLIDVDASEPFGGNALLLGESVVYPEAFPRTRARLEAAGIAVRTVPADELAKAEGGVTCSAILVT